DVVGLDPKALWSEPGDGLPEQATVLVQEDPPAVLDVGGGAGVGGRFPAEGSLASHVFCWDGVLRQGKTFPRPATFPRNSEPDLLDPALLEDHGPLRVGPADPAPEND